MYFILVFIFIGLYFKVKIKNRVFGINYGCWNISWFCVREMVCEFCWVLIWYMFIEIYFNIYFIKVLVNWKMN